MLKRNIYLSLFILIFILIIVICFSAVETEIELNNLHKLLLNIDYQKHLLLVLPLN